MTRRDFAGIADTIRHHLHAADDAGDAGSVLVMDALARDLADRFGNASLAFDRDGFLTACGITPPE